MESCTTISHLARGWIAQSSASKPLQGLCLKSHCQRMSHARWTGSHLLSKWGLTWSSLWKTEIASASEYTSLSSRQAIALSWHSWNHCRDSWTNLLSQSMAILKWYSAEEIVGTSLLLKTYLRLICNRIAGKISLALTRQGTTMALSPLVTGSLWWLAMTGTTVDRLSALKRVTSKDGASSLLAVPYFHERLFPSPSSIRKSLPSSAASTATASPETVPSTTSKNRSWAPFLAAKTTFPLPAIASLTK